jgi:hypothetical protein
MNIILTIIRGLMAIIAPLATLVFIVLILRQTRGATGAPPIEDESCLRCGSSQPGGEGQFHFTEGVGNARERAANPHYATEKTPILGSETHFICDDCARHFLRNEITQILILVLPYPIYLYILVPLFFPNGIFASFLVETLLVVLSISGLISAYDLYRATRQGESPLDEARDKVAINERRGLLGKKLGYYSRMGIRQINK